MPALPGCRLIARNRSARAVRSVALAFTGGGGAPAGLGAPTPVKDDCEGEGDSGAPLLPSGDARGTPFVAGGAALSCGACVEVLSRLPSTPVLIPPPVVLDLVMPVAVPPLPAPLRAGPCGNAPTRGAGDAGWDWDSPAPAAGVWAEVLGVAERAALRLVAAEATACGRWYASTKERNAGEKYRHCRTELA